MTPEAHKPPETQPGSANFVDGIHPTDGVREFKGDADLADVSPALLERGVPDASKIHPDTLDVAVDKIEVKSKKRRNRLIASVAGGAVATAAIAVGAATLSRGDDQAPERDRSSASSEPTADREVSPDASREQPSDTSIDDLTGPSSPEQIQYVIDNPVSVADYPDPVNSLGQLSSYMNVLYHADPATVSELDASGLYGVIYDTSNPLFEEGKAEMDQRREIATAERVLHGEGFESSVSLQPTEQTGTETNEGVVINTNILYSSNSDQFYGANLETYNDYNADIILTNDGKNWHIWGIKNSQEVGNIG